jgi:large subunit ribosomal protein L25
MDFILNAKSRQDTGKGASRRLRREGLVPAVVYGGEPAPESITLSQSDLAKIMKSDAFYSTIINLSVDGASQEVIVKDIQRHAYKELIAHMDFQRIVRGQTMKFTVPLNFINEEQCEGVKLEGGEIHRLASEVEIECRPSALPESIDVDLTPLKIGDSLHLSELNLADGLSIVALQHEDENSDIMVVNVQAAHVKAEEPTEAPEAPAQPGDEEEESAE